MKESQSSCLKKKNISYNIKRTEKRVNNLLNKLFMEFFSVFSKEKHFKLKKESQEFVEQSILYKLKKEERKLEEMLLQNILKIHKEKNPIW